MSITLSGSQIPTSAPLYTPPSPIPRFSWLSHLLENQPCTFRIFRTFRSTFFKPDGIQQAQKYFQDGKNNSIGIWISQLGSPLYWAINPVCREYVISALIFAVNHPLAVTRSFISPCIPSISPPPKQNHHVHSQPYFFSQCRLFWFREPSEIDRDGRMLGDADLLKWRVSSLRISFISV